MIEPDAVEEEPRVRRTSRPARIGIAVALILASWGTLWLARPRSATSPSPGITPSASPLGDAPVQVGSRYICNRGEQLRAFDLGKVFYPPNHPFAPPDSSIPARCFRTFADAEEAGYTLAPIGAADGIEVDGIYLVHPRVPLTLPCLSIAGQVGFTVPCPDLLPWPGGRIGNSQCSFDEAINMCAYLNTFTLAEDRFAVPVGHQAAHSNLVLVAFKSDPLNGGLACPNGTRVGTDLVKVQNRDEEIPADVIDCPLDAVDLLVAGHVILRWKEAGVTYEVALQGNFDDTLALLQAIASNLELIGPPPS